jgi:hypothetical protein
VWHEIPGYLNAPQILDGKLSVQIPAGINDLGEVKLNSKQFAVGANPKASKE